MPVDMTKTILLVEDDVDSRQMLLFYLESCGFSVAEAEDGFDAIEYVGQVVPDLILMDLSMPRMDGLTATRHIKENPRAADVPIICLTAFSSYYEKEALAAGCREVLPKPVDLENLIKVVETYIAGVAVN